MAQPRSDSPDVRAAVSDIASRARASVARLLDASEGAVQPLAFTSATLRTAVAHSSRSDSRVFDHRIVDALTASAKTVEAASHAIEAELPKAIDAASEGSSHVVELFTVDKAAMMHASREAANAQRCLSLGCRASVVPGEVVDGVPVRPTVTFEKDWAALPENPEEVQEAALRFDGEKEAWLRRIARSMQQRT